jgi:hypothetical protein
MASTGLGLKQRRRIQFLRGGRIQAPEMNDARNLLVDRLGK